MIPKSSMVMQRLMERRGEHLLNMNLCGCPVRSTVLNSIMVSSFPLPSLIILCFGISQNTLWLGWAGFDYFGNSFHRYESTVFIAEGALLENKGHFFVYCKNLGGTCSQCPSSYIYGCNAGTTYKWWKWGRNKQVLILNAIKIQWMLITYWG